MHAGAPAAALSDVCPICDGYEFAYMWSIDSAHLNHCTGCGLVRRDRPESHSQAATVDAVQEWKEVKPTIDARLAVGDVLVIGEEVPLPFEAGTTRSIRMIDSDALAALDANASFATIVVVSALAAVRDPIALLRTVRTHLAGDGLLVIAQPTIDGPVAGRIAQGAAGWKVPAQWHFTRQTLHLALLRAGFDRVWFRTVPDGRLVATAQPGSVRQYPRLSVIVPVFNEARTCETMLTLLLAKTIPGVEKEIVVVESNSTDGTRAIVERYRNHPGVRLVLEDRPRGKGHAVRAGLQQATGEIVLIQDADLEYDIEDYESLLQPLLAWQTLFVLGSRHSGHWKMRHFNDAPMTAAVFNLGHVFYTWLVNTVLGTRMSDPFTMFKVFRRDCLHGLTFTGQRFDFDFELVMKLVRKGYLPLERPVNYNARSFTEGKKVSFFRDGLTWIWVVLKYGYGPLGSGDRTRF